MTTTSAISAHAVSKAMSPGDERRKDPGGDTEEMSEESLRCGYLCWRPDWLQRFNHPRFLLACVCWSTFVQGTR